MGELRDKDIIRTRPLIIDEMFSLPTDLDEGLYDTGRGDGSPGAGAELRYVPGGGFSDPDRVLSDPTRPPVEVGTDVPTNIHVKSQVFRFSSDGSYVVDVILGFDDVRAAAGYEVRIAT